FAFHKHTYTDMVQAKEAYVGFGCGTTDNVICIPFATFAEWLEGMNTTDNKGRYYWHVSISAHQGNFILHRRKGYSSIDLNKWLLSGIS
ncbi:MAG TPA: hypothetical protein VIG44_08840, partial [Thermomicrobiales bacterium]